MVLLLCVMSTDTQLVDGLLWGPHGSAHMPGTWAGEAGRWAQLELSTPGGLQKGRLSVVSAQGSQSVCPEKAAAGRLLGSSFGLPSMSLCHIPLTNHVPRAGLDQEGGLRLPFCGRRSKDCVHL